MNCHVSRAALRDATGSTVFLRAVIAAASSVAMIATDRSGTITLFSSGAEKMLGYSSAETVGRLSPFEFHLPQEIESRQSEIRDQWRPAADASGMPVEAQWTMVRKDASLLSVRLSVSILKDADGHSIGYLGVATDISEQVEQGQRLNRARRAAEAASRAKSEFLAAMSHEIRTPMNGILGMAGLLLSSELTPRQRKRLETLRNSGEGLMAVLNDILDFSRIEASKLELEVADFDLRKLVEEVADLMGVRAQEKSVEMLCSIDPEVPTRLQGDPNRLRQILSNLLGNAVKFTSDGCISLTVRLEQPRQLGVLRFEVADTGIGIPEAKRHLLFQPFSQADTSNARCYGGTGLGLSIVSGLVKMLGGEVGLESTDGSGSTFWFTAKLPAQPEIKRPRALSLDGTKVLVVDDSAPGRNLLSGLLNYWGCCPEQAATSAEALERLTAANVAPFDLVLIDLDMPDLSGDKLASLIRSQPALRHLRLVLMTDLRHPADAAWWHAQGFDGQVTKPVKQGELGGCLATVLGHGPGAAPGPAAPFSRDLKLAARKGHRLLLVEDNLVNQEVALGILELLGYSADVAPDGKLALALLRQNSYSAVLTDCELPELDGYQLTRLIRDPATLVRNRDVPVIAMTAHALAGDRQKCLLAGMDDYVAKPVNPAALEEILDRCAGIATENPSTRHTPDNRETADFDPEELVDRLMGDENLARRVVDRFVRDMPSQLTSLADAICSDDRQSALLLAHSVKGAAANVTGASLTHLAAAVENSMREGDLPGAQQGLLALTSEFDSASLNLKRFLDERP